MSNTEKLYINESEAAQRYGYSRQWFQRERWKGTGPKFVKIKSGKILYSIEKTDLWFQSFGYKQSTSEYDTHQRQTKKNTNLVENN
jgi:predicted DNA-binding transcriptional regulator AlpA